MVIYRFCISHQTKMWPGLQKSIMWAQITPSYIFANIFSSECGIPFPSISEESSLNSAVVTEILLCLCKQFVSYDRAKMEKISDFFALTWLIFAGPVTNDWQHLIHVHIHIHYGWSVQLKKMSAKCATYGVCMMQ